MSTDYKTKVHKFLIENNFSQMTSSPQKVIIPYSSYQLNLVQ